MVVLELGVAHRHFFNQVCDAKFEHDHGSGTSGSGDAMMSESDPLNWAWYKDKISHTTKDGWGTLTKDKNKISRTTKDG